MGFDTLKGNKMKLPNERLPRTREQIAGGIIYAAGYLLAAATFVKFAWWVWMQPW
jgi:hypothetical protein